MTIEQIYNSKDISVRAFNVCNDNGLNDLSSILQYYRKNRSFESLRNCGKKSNLELIAVCVKYFNNIAWNVNEFEDKEVLIVDRINKFNRIQREVINSFIETSVNNLSLRSRNAFILYLDKDIKIKNIAEKILTNQRFNFQDINNIGSKSVVELNEFISALIRFIEEVSSFEVEKDLIPLKNKFFLEKTFSETTIPSEIIEAQSIIKLIDFLLKVEDADQISFSDDKYSILDTDPIWSNKKSKPKSLLKAGSNNLFTKIKVKLVFQKALKIYNNKIHKNLDEIAEECNLTRERVRQIKNICLEDILNNFKFIKFIDDDLFHKYGIDCNQDIIIIDEALKDTINEINQTNFSAEFLSFLIFVNLSDKFELVGEIDDVLQPKYFNSKDSHQWKNFYLVNKKISSLFNFHGFANDLDKRLSERIEETYGFHFTSYLNNFIKIEDNSQLSMISPIAERIINQEFDLFIDLNDNIVFNRNTIKQVREYVIEALEKLGAPSNIEEIYNLIVEIHPEITKSPEALRGSLQRSPEIIYFGRSSTYGLKKWEIEKEGIKGGTIKDIIFEYLQVKTDPIHILELLNEVHKYRDKTNARNIITNLKLDPQKQFIIFNQSFIGLSGKTYNSNLTSLPKFLGKTVTNYVNQQKFTNRITIEEYFSIHLKISQRNMKYIIDHLIEQQFVFIDNQSNLSI
jgi:hypothetical protein